MYNMFEAQVNGLTLSSDEMKIDLDVKSAEANLNPARVEMVHVKSFQLTRSWNPVVYVLAVATLILAGCAQKEAVSCSDIVNAYVLQYKDYSFGKSYNDSKADLVKNAEMCAQTLDKVISSKNPIEVEAIADFAFEMPVLFQTDKLVKLEADWRSKMPEIEDSNLAVFQLAKAVTTGESRIALPYVRKTMMENEIAGAGVLHGLLQKGKDDQIESIIEDCLQSSKFRESAKGVRLLRKYSISLKSNRTNSDRMKSLGMKIEEALK